MNLLYSIFIAYITLVIPITAIVSLVTVVAEIEGARHNIIPCYGRALLSGILQGLILGLLWPVFALLFIFILILAFFSLIGEIYCFIKDEDK